MMKKIVDGYPLHVILIAIVYLGAARLGLMLAYPGTNATPIWPATGIALSAVLLLGSRIWPGIALGAFIANYEYLAGLGLSPIVSLAASFGTSAGNTLEALAGAYLVRRFTGRNNPFERSADVLVFIVFGALISTTLSATIGTSTFCLSISEWKNFASVWLTWWLGDAAGAIVLVPLLMTYKEFGDIVWKFRPLAGSLFIAISIVAVCSLVFWMGYPLIFLLLPILIISAFRLGRFGSAVAICIISGLSIYGTVNGTGPFVATTLNESLLLLQGFIGSIASATMVSAVTVSEKKKSESKLMESEQKYRWLVENANSIILRWARDGKITFMNEFGQQFFGYSEAEIIGCHVVGTIVPESESTGRDLRPLMDEICADPKKFERNINENMRCNGERVWIDWTNKVVSDEQGQITEILSIGSDITGRKRAEEEIRTVNEELLSINRIITTTTTTATGVKDILETILDEALHITGLEGGTICLVGPDETLQLTAHRATSEATIFDLTTNEVKVGDCLCGECARDHRPLILRSRGEVLKFSTREATRGEDIRFHAAFPLIIGERCLGILCVFTRTDFKPAERRLKLLETVTAQIAIAVDNARMFEEISHNASILENKVLERTSELQAANEKLKELDRLKSMFIASMSHELRTPLNSIIGFTGIILQGMSGELNDQQKDQLRRVYSAAKHLLSLISDVIDISKIEAGKIEAYPETVVLRELIDEAVASLRTEIDRKGLTVKTSILQDLTLNTDRKRLLQCVLNYMSNAVKFTERGTIHVEAGLVSAQKEKGQPQGEHLQNMIEIRVEDSGIGIREEDVPRLFQSFVRFDSHLKTLVPGTGLGLYLTKKLATEILGGTVSAESVYGKGSVFNIRIPREIGQSI